MSRLNFLHKEIVLPNYCGIKDEFKSYYDEKIKDSGLITQFFNPIDKQNCMAHVPQFMDWVSRQNLKVRGITYIRAKPYTAEGIHIDSPTEHYNPWDNLVSLALNIPITQNCENSHTIWYKKINGRVRNDVINNTVNLDIPYVKYDLDTHFEEIERISLKTSTILNIRIFHNVVNPTDIDRVAVSVRFDVDPWWLVE